MVLNDHTGWVYCTAVIDGGKKIISGSADKSLRINTINIESLLIRMRKNVSGNMTEKDWDKYVGTDIPYSRELPK